MNIDLTESDIESYFKIKISSYQNPDNIFKTKWKFHFEKESDRKGIGFRPFILYKRSLDRYCMFDNSQKLKEFIFDLLNIHELNCISLTSDSKYGWSYEFGIGEIWFKDSLFILHNILKRRLIAKSIF